MAKRRTYAEDTRVTVMQTKADIERLVYSHGATGFGVMEMNGRVQIAFQMNDRNILFRVDTPDKPQQQRARWRCLLLTIKSKLESAQAGIETFDEAFLAHTVMPDGHTVADHTLPRVAQQYDGNPNVPLLPPAH